MNSEAELWWQTIPGAQVITRSIAERMLQQNSLVVYTDGGMPWVDVLRMQVREQVQHRNANLLVESCNAASLGKMTPGEWVLERFGGQIFRLPSMIPEQVALENGVLRDRIFWVCGFENKAQVKAWTDFARLLHKNRSRRCGCVVLLLEAGLPVPGNVEQLRTGDYISEYDLAFFAAALITQTRLPYWEKKYLSELAVSLSMGSAERCAEQVFRGKQLLEAPERYASGNPDAIHCIWRGQMQTVFARIEETKLALVQRNASDLQPLLGTKDDFGNVIEGLEHIELRHMVHALRQREIRLPEKEEQIVRVLHGMRNELAHHRLLSYAQMRELFDLFGT